MRCFPRPITMKQWAEMVSDETNKSAIKAVSDRKGMFMMEYLRGRHTNDTAWMKHCRKWYLRDECPARLNLEGQLSTIEDGVDWCIIVVSSIAATFFAILGSTALPLGLMIVAFLSWSAIVWRGWRK